MVQNKLLANVYYYVLQIKLYKKCLMLSQFYPLDNSLYTVICYPLVFVNKGFPQIYLPLQTSSTVKLNFLLIVQIQVNILDVVCLPGSL